MTSGRRGVREWFGDWLEIWGGPSGASPRLVEGASSAAISGVGSEASRTALVTALLYVPSLLLFGWFAATLARLGGSNLGFAVGEMLPLTVGLWRIFTRPRALRGWRRAAYVLPVASFASYLALAAPLVMRAGKSGKQAAAPVASSAQRLPHTSQDGLVSLELPVDFRETLAKPSTTVLMVSSSVVTLMVGDEVLSDPDRNLDLNQYAARILRRQSELTALAPIEEPSVAGYWGLRLPLRQNLGVRKAELFVTRSRSHFVSFFVFAEPGYDLGDRTFDLVRQARIND